MSRFSSSQNHRSTHQQHKITGIPVECLRLYICLNRIKYLMASANTLHCPCFNLNVGKCMEIKKPPVVEFDYILWHSREFDFKTCWVFLLPHTHTLSLSRCSVQLFFLCTVVHYQLIPTPLCTSQDQKTITSFLFSSHRCNGTVQVVLLQLLQLHSTRRVSSVSGNHCETQK